MVRARTDKPYHWFFGSRRLAGILALSVGELIGRSKPIWVACHKLPPSTVINTSAGVLRPSARIFSIKGPAWPPTSCTLVPVFFSYSATTGLSRLSAREEYTTNSLANAGAATIKANEAANVVFIMFFPLQSV